MIALQILTIVILLAILAVLAAKRPFVAETVVEQKEEKPAAAEPTEAQKKQDELLDKGFENIMTYSVKDIGIRHKAD